MKRIIFFSAIALWLFAAASCDKEDVILKGHLNVKNLLHNGCKNNTQKSTEQEYLILQANGQYLEIEHINAEFNCCPGEILVDSNISNDSIFINEDETEHACDCVCKYDLTYELGPLEYGVYHIILSNTYYTPIEFDVDFNPDTDEVIDIEYKKQ